MAKIARNRDLVFALGLGCVLAIAIAQRVAGKEPAAPASQRYELTVDLNSSGPRIEPEIYGQFSEHAGIGIYDGIWVGEGSRIPNVRGIRSDVVAALKKIKVPVLRWPGGCFADQYNWRDGVGPRSSRPVRRNIWGGTESNQFGTHEFMDFAAQIGAQPFISVNVGSGAIKEAQAWLSYMTDSEETALALERRQNGRAQPWKLKYVGIGNEMWGCGGNMRAEFYADQVRQFSAFITREQRYLIASGPLDDDPRFTEALMKNASWTYPHTDLRVPFFQAISLHHYTSPDGEMVAYKPDRGTATDFDERGWFTMLKTTLRMDKLITGHSATMDKYDLERQIALVVDEWGASYQQDPKAPALYQQNTLRDAFVAALTLNIFHRYTARVKMANIAQMINTVQAMILTDEERMVLTPTYHVFKMYVPFQGALPLVARVSGPAYEDRGEILPGVDVSAGQSEDGRIVLSMANLNPTIGATLSTNLTGKANGRLLTAPAMNSHNTFDAPASVSPSPFIAGNEGRQLKFELPPKSIVVVTVKP